MRIGLVSPIVTAVPGVAQPWERSAGIEQLARIAEAADRLGFDHLTCSEHVAVPTQAASSRGGRYWDPLATFGYLAARTTRIRLATRVLVLGYHHPLALAKRYGTLDMVSGGRLVLGVGVGSLEEEFELLGARFDDRGAIADDALAALRASLSRQEPEHHGPHFDFADVVVEPCSVQPRVPIWVGGRSRRSLRRALELGDGWVPFGLAPAQLQRLLAETEVPASFDVVLQAPGLLDPLDAPDATTEALAAATAAGATIVTASIFSTSAEHYVEQLAALAGLAGLQEVRPIGPQAS